MPVSATFAMPKSLAGIQTYTWADRPLEAIQASAASLAVKSSVAEKNRNESKTFLSVFSKIS
jgi:hypothetical protein